MADKNDGTPVCGDHGNVDGRGILGLTVALLAVGLLGLWVAVQARLPGSARRWSAGGSVSSCSPRISTRCWPMRQLLKIAATKRLKGARQTEIRPLQHVVTNATREGHSMNSLSALINLAIVWGVASATGFLAMAALMIAGDWTLLQALFAAAIIFFVFGTLLSFLFLKPVGGPVEPGKMAHADPAPTVPSMTPLRSSTPAASARAAPKSEEGSTGPPRRSQRPHPHPNLPR
jgi:hypothetical protein